MSSSSLNWTHSDHDDSGVLEGVLKFIWQHCVGPLEKKLGTVLDNITAHTVNTGQ